MDPADAGTATSPGQPRASASSAPPLPQLVTELWELVIAYVKQETVVPLKKLGRYLVLGIAGSLLLGFSAIFFGMAGLRALQTETGDTFTRDWSWAPYGIVFVGLLLGAAISWKARGALRKEST